MFEDIRLRLYDQYQDVCIRLALLSLRDLAETVSAAFPGATKVVMSDSDQGPHLVLEYAENHVGQMVANAEQLRAAGIEGSDTAGNLSPDNIAYARWKRYAPVGRDAHNHDGRIYRLDIAEALTIPSSAFTPPPANPPPAPAAKPRV